MFRLAGGVSLDEVYAPCARSAERQNRRDRRTAHGNGTAFTALAPLEQPVLAVHRSNTREWNCPQARIAGHLTFHLVVRFRPHRYRISVSAQCHLFATYRPVSCSSASTICQCIAREGLVDRRSR